MFPIFIYSFCALVSLWTGRYFYMAWRKSRTASIAEFSMFFFVLALGFIIYLISPIVVVPFAGAAAEIGLFFILISFAFVLRVFARFENISLSPNAMSVAVMALIGTKLVLDSIPWFLPGVNDILVQWHYPVTDSFVFGALVAIFSLAVGYVLMAHSVDVGKYAREMVFLGFAFFIGGISGVLLPNATDVRALFAGYLLLFTAFLFVTLFVLNISRKKRI